MQVLYEDEADYLGDGTHHVVDCGYWRGRLGGVFRLSYNAEGEQLYLAKLAAGGPLDPTATVFEVELAHYGQGWCEVIATIPRGEQRASEVVDTLLDGWPTFADERGGLEWLKGRLHAQGLEVRPA